MERFFTCLLCCISLMWSAHALAQQPDSLRLPPTDFLASLEPNPSPLDLYEFLSAYDSDFTQCRQMDAYLKALSYLAQSGEKETVRRRLMHLSKCPGLSQQTLNQAKKLASGIGFPSLFGSPPQHPPLASSSGQPQPPAVSSPNRTVIEPAPTAQPVALPTQEQPIRQKRKKSIKTPAAVTRTALTKPTPTQPVRTVFEEKLDKKEQSAPPLTSALTTNHHYRDGKKGTSRFYRSDNTLSIEYGEITASVHSVYATSFSDLHASETGSPYRGIPTKKLRTEETVFFPELSYEDKTVSIKFGTSPIGGTVHPYPTARLKYTIQQLAISAYHDVVTDSLLSYVGFTDIYSGEKMGRVMQGGAKLEWNDTFQEDYFYGLTVNSAYFHGKNVKENTGIKGEAFLGKKFGGLSAGVYASADHFAYNLNNYTYGHGGYYSPHLAAAGACFISWEYRSPMFYFKADTSLGHLYEEIKESSQYYHSKGKGTDYKGERSNKFTANTGLEAAVGITEDVSLSLNTRLSTSGKYFETRGNLGLEVRF